jgi:hypothetical protein
MRVLGPRWARTRITWWCPTVPEKLGADRVKKAQYVQEERMPGLSLWAGWQAANDAP